MFSSEHFVFFLKMFILYKLEAKLKEKGKNCYFRKNNVFFRYYYVLVKKQKHLLTFFCYYLLDTVQNNLHAAIFNQWEILLQKLQN